jgi:AcrR family transcriptional regulator
MPRRDKRQQIMDAAEGLFQDRRFHEITLDQVAAAARVGKGTIYLHFKDKDDLFFQTATSGFDGLCELLRNRVPERDSFDRQISRACREIHEFFKSRPHLSRMMHSEDGLILRSQGRIHTLWLEKRKKLVAALAHIVRKGVAEGAIRGDIAPEALANFLLGLLRTRALDLAEASSIQPSIESVADLFRNGASNRRRKAAAR